MATIFALPQFTFEQFLEKNKRSQTKLEFLHGMVYAMAGASKFHNAIAMRCATALSNRLNGSGCEVFGSDQMVETPGQEAGFYPDITIECAGSLVQSNQPLRTPILVLEVLSPSTRNYDLSTKLTQYQFVPSLRHILFVDSEEVGVQLYSRRENEVWPGTPTTFTTRDQTIDLPSLGVSLTVEEIYRDLNFSIPAA